MMARYGGMQMRRCALCLAMLFAVAGVATGSTLEILCSTTIVGDVVRAVAGSDVMVTVLLPPGADPHAVQPSPADVVAIEEADVVFINGAGLEEALAALLASARGPVVDLSAGLHLRAPDAHNNGGDDRFLDPHVWFDPWNVMEWTRAIAQALAAADSEMAAGFAARAAAYEAELVALDAWIRDRVAVLPEDSRLLVTDHEALGYFADRYGFVEIGAIFPGTSTLAEPSAQERADLEDAIRVAGVPAVFVGTRVSTTLAEQVAADTGTQIVFLYTGSLSEPDGPAATYVNFMRYDVEAIVAALYTTP
jgi:manganese/iron transport system substrate-binding protein